MEEIAQLHALSLEWGCLTNLMDKIITLEDKAEEAWPELEEMLGDIMVEEARGKDPVSAFFNLYGFMMHLYFRLKANPKKQPFNRYSYDDKLDVYYIRNYDYAAYKWILKKKEGNMGVDNSSIAIPSEMLTDKEKAVFDRRCKKI